MMKLLKKILFGIIIGTSLNATAQQDAHFTHFMYNQLYINPAFAGSGRVMNNAFFYRNQWLQISDNPISPVTQTYTAHMPVSNKQGIGAGFIFLNERIGFEKHLNLMGCASYALDLNDVSFTGKTNKKLYMGMQFGIRQFKIDINSLDPHEQGDLVIPELAQSVLTPEVGVGFLYKSDAFYAGVSIPHMLQTRIKFTDYQMLNARQVRHYYVMSGYQYKLTEDFTLKPNVLMKYVVNAPLEIDLNALVEYQGKFWGGLSVRTRDAVAFLMGVNTGELSPNFKEKIKIGYSFDLTVSGLPKYNRGTHEIFIVYDIDLAEKKLLPKFMN